VDVTSSEARRAIVALLLGAALGVLVGLLSRRSGSGEAAPSGRSR
jgi:hypothetical protein